MKVIYLYVICIAHTGESICLPADQETDIGISCSRFITQLPTLIQTCPPLLTQYVQYIVYLFSQASFLALVNRLMGLNYGKFNIRFAAVKVWNHLDESI